MSTEQSEDETQTAPDVKANSQADITQQATTPTTTTHHVKNPKRVAAGKMVAERTRIAREQQKKAAAEASIIIANNKAKATTAAPETAPTTEGGEKNSGLSINQWLAVGSLVVSLLGIYYKREELKDAFSKKTPEPAPEPKPSSAAQPKGLRKMDLLNNRGQLNFPLLYTKMLDVDVLQLFFNTPAIIGIGMVWFSFNKMVFKKVLRLATMPFFSTEKEADDSNDGINEQGYCSDDCSEARAQVPEDLHFYIS